MSDLINQIRQAQVRAGEDVVVENLRAMGLIKDEPVQPSIHVDYAKLQEFADQNRIDYNMLCVAARAAIQVDDTPLDAVLHCPVCHLQHIDEPEHERDMDVCEGPEVVDTVIVGWDNPPHRSHLCHGCGHIWRPLDVPTNGVQALKTRGQDDSPIAAPAAPAEGARTDLHKWATEAAKLLGPEDHEVRDKLREALASAPPAPALSESDPLQGAATWLKQAVLKCDVSDLMDRLLIGYNRAGRLFDAAPNQTPTPAAQGLSDAEIEAEVQRSFSRGTSHWLFAMGVRFAEQRHGIIAASRTTPKDDTK